MIASADLLAVQLPGVAAFRRRVVDHLTAGASVLCLVSEGGFLTSLREQLLSDLEDAYLDYALIDLAEGGSSLPPPSQLLRHQLGLSPATTPEYSLQHLMQDTNWPSVVVLIGLEQCQATERQCWLRFFEEWANATHSAASVSGGSKPRLLAWLIPQDGDLLPQEETFLRRVWWWSLPSSLEMALLCRLLAEGEARVEPSHLLWREALLPVLAGNDTALLEYLWPNAFADPSQLLRHLTTYALKCGWSAAALRRWGADSYRGHASVRSPDRLDATGRGLWARGVLAHTVEHGLRLSSAALAMMGDTANLRHRLWQGQAALVLPLVNQVRLGACRHVASGPSPHPSLIEIDDADHDSLEWGPLKQRLREVSNPALRHLGSRVEHAHKVRNTLAHYSLIRFVDFERLLMNMV